MTIRFALVAAAAIQIAACGDSPPTPEPLPAQPQTVGDAAAPEDAGAPPDAAAASDGESGTDARDCMPTVHPGTVTLLNETTGEVRTQAVTPDNEDSFWVNTPQGRVPVVKLVFRRLPGLAAEITSYGPCDQVLEVTVGH